MVKEENKYKKLYETASNIQDLVTDYNDLLDENARLREEVEYYRKLQLERNENDFIDMERYLKDM